MMRTKNSIRNVIASLSSNIVSIIVGFVAQAIFIKLLGSEYLGLNGLFSNIISMMAIVEMGIGSAIIYNLYKPIAENDIEKIKSLMKFYKKNYHLIALLVSIIGIVIIPFLPFITGEVTIHVNTTIVYLLFLLDSVFSYFLSYKRSILYANQKHYVVHIIHIAYTIILNLSQLLILYFTKNYYLYLIIKIVMRVIENLVITVIANKMYSYLNSKDILPLDKNVEKDIFKKVKALFFHQIGGFIVSGTDNIIISKYLGLVFVGLYANYFLIINSVQIIFKQIIQATTASIGNLLVTESVDKQYMVFKRIRFLNFWITTFSGISILIIMDSFISIWIGDKYILPTIVLIVLVLNYYQKSTRYTFVAFKEAAGIFYEDRFVPLIESLINIIASIILVKYFGLAGVFMGTIVSSLILWCFSYPKYVYKKLFSRSYIDYMKETIGYVFLFLILSNFTYYISTLVNFENIYFEFLSNILISLVIPNVILTLLFFKTDNFKYYLKLIKRKKLN